MHDRIEWQGLPERSRALSPTRDRLIYLEHLRGIHDDEEFRLALTDGVGASEAEVTRFLTDAEMLANYGVI